MAGRILIGGIRSVSTILTNRCVYQAGAANVASVRRFSDDAPISLPENPFEREKKQCVLCKYAIEPDYKNAKLLSQFQSPYTGRVYGRHITGLCKSKQEKVEREIARAQGIGYMPYYFKDLKFLKDPRLFDPERPTRQHPY